MRTLFVLILLGCALTVAAEQPVITGFAGDGTLTWTNAQDTYCGIECNWNLTHTWLPVDTTTPVWNTFVTQAVGSVQLDLDGMWDLMTHLDGNLLISFQGFFFRVVASDAPLGPRFATNYVYLTNASTSVLRNVAIGLKQNGATGPALTNFPTLGPDSATPGVAVWQEIKITFGSLTNQIAPLVSWSAPVPDGWYLSYDHAGSNRVLEAPVIQFGPPEKNIVMTVSNTSISISVEWLNLRGTLNY